MAGIHGHDFNKGLLLILHTPGGSAEAAQTIVEYLRSKFDAIDVLIPTYAMSAGTMIRSRVRPDRDGTAKSARANRSSAYRGQ